MGNGPAADAGAHAALAVPIAAAGGGLAGARDEALDGIGLLPHPGAAGHGPLGGPDARGGGGHAGVADGGGAMGVGVAHPALLAAPQHHPHPHHHVAHPPMIAQLGPMHRQQRRDTTVCSRAPGTCGRRLHRIGLQAQSTEFCYSLPDRVPGHLRRESPCRIQTLNAALSGEGDLCGVVLRWPPLLLTLLEMTLTFLPNDDDCNHLGRTSTRRFSWRSLARDQTRRWEWGTRRESNEADEAERAVGATQVGASGRSRAGVAST